MDKKVYVVSNYDIDNCVVVNLTEDQAKAINWFIDWADVDCGINSPKEAAEDI